MRRVRLAFALGSLVMCGVMFGPAAGRACAQSAGSTSPRASTTRGVPPSTRLVWRYYYYDPGTGRYYYYDVPAGYTYSSAYPYNVRSLPSRSNSTRRSAAGIGAQGTDGRTSPDEG